MTIKVTLFSALIAVMCSCGGPSKSVTAEHLPDRPVVATPEPAEDPDPTIRIVAQYAPCFPKGPTYHEMFENIALVKRLIRENDEEALTTLQANGMFVMLSPGTRFKLWDTTLWPHRYGTVKSKRFIGTLCTIESVNLVKRKDQQPDVSVQEEIAERERTMQGAREVLRKYGY
jgi:hypothetical protein